MGTAKPVKPPLRQAFRFAIQGPARAKQSKYKNAPTVANGERFDSAAECARYQQLLLLERAGAIKDLTRQASFELAPAAFINGSLKRALTYRADFAYVDVATGKRVIEDKKGAFTAVYKVKRHLMKTVHNIDILET